MLLQIKVRLTDVNIEMKIEHMDDSLYNISKYTSLDDKVISVSFPEIIVDGSPGEDTVYVCLRGAEDRRDFNITDFRVTDPQRGLQITRRVVDALSEIISTMPGALPVYTTTQDGEWTEYTF